MTAEWTPESVAILRRRTGRETVKASFALQGPARPLMKAALQPQHPDWTEDPVLHRVNEIFLNAAMGPVPEDKSYKRVRV